MSELLSGTSTHRLKAYAAAAGLGAFAFGQHAQGFIFPGTVMTNSSLDGTTFQHSGLASNGDDYTVDIDIDGDGTNDVRLGVFLNAIGMTGFPGNAVLSDSTTGALSYYVIGFQNGDIIDGSADETGGGVNLAFVTPYVALYGGYRYQIKHVDDGEWIGVRFDINGTTAFGAIEVVSFDGLGALDQNGDNDPNGVGDFSNDPVRVTLGTMIWYEVPEPASLAVLAAGLGAVGLRRRA